MGNTVLVALIVAASALLNALADPYLLGKIREERARRANRKTDAPGGEGDWPRHTIRLLVDVALGVGLVLFGLYAILFPDDVFIASVGPLEGILSGIALAGTGLPLILMGLWTSYRPAISSKVADGPQGPP